MERYEDALLSGVAALNAQGGEMPHAQWKTFAQSLRLQEKYPGINGIGIIRFMKNEDVAAFVARERVLRPQFSISPAHSYPLAMPITQIEPLDINRQALGLDVAHEGNRREAALDSRDSGKARITGPIILVQDQNATPGFLFYAPFYERATPDTVQAHQEHALGLVYAPFIVSKLMAGVLSKENRDLHFKISDGDTVLYDELSTADTQSDPDPLYQSTVSLELYGRDWDIEIETNQAFRAGNTFIQPFLILVSGLVIEVLIVGIFVVLKRSNKQATKHALRMTKALRTEKNKLAKTNDEIEQFVYVASHDLKTPVRGIGGLTEMIQDDLSEYFSSEQANTQVARNLNRILKRVAKINALTDGIIEYSQIGYGAQNGEPITIEELLSALRQDFGLSDTELKVSSQVDAVAFDAPGFTRILENLVGNAVKYHHQRSELEIRVSIAANHDRLEVSVSDNGPGILSGFQSKAFEPFQTLSNTPSIDSTGIGLASVRKTVEAHGFQIDLISETGQGCHFSFSWPIASVNPHKTLAEAA